MWSNASVVRDEVAGNSLGDGTSTHGPAADDVGHRLVRHTVEGDPLCYLDVTGHLEGCSVGGRSSKSAYRQLVPLRSGGYETRCDG